MLALIITIIGIITYLFSYFIGIILTLVGFFIAKREMKKEKKYSKQAHTISLIAFIIEVIIVIVFNLYDTITVKNVIDDTNEKINEISKNSEIE